VTIFNATVKSIGLLECGPVGPSAVSPLAFTVGRFMSSASYIATCSLTLTRVTGCKLRSGIGCGLTSTRSYI